MADQHLDDANALSSSFSGRSTNGTIQVNGKNYAVGLIWEHVSEGRGNAKAVNQAREAAKRHSGDLFCVRKPAKTQYGIGNKSIGHKAGMAPMASFLAEAIEGSFVAIFEIENAYYLAAVRDDQVLAGCDRVITDRSEAMESFAELYYGSTWTQQIAPKDWSIDGTSPVAIDAVIGGFRPKTVLSTVSKSLNYIFMVGAIVLLGGGYYAYQQHLDYLEEQERIRILNQNTKVVQKPAAAPVIPLPWERKQFGVPAMIACVDNILNAPLDAPGWQPLQLTCIDGRISVVYKRAGGTINWVGAIMNNSKFHPSISQSGADNVTVSWTIPLAPVYDKDSKTAPRSEVRRYLVSQFEEVFQPIEIKLEDPRPIPVNTGKGTQNVPAPYQGLAFSFKTRHDPKEFAEILAPIPVITLASVKLDLGTWTWNIEGNVYEKIDTTGQPTQNSNAKPVQPTQPAKGPNAN